MMAQSAPLQSAGVRVLVLGVLVLLLLAPVGLVLGLVHERAARSQSVQEEIAASWGRPQRLVGPLLVLPYRLPAPRTAPAAEGEGPPVAPEPRLVVVQLAPDRLSWQGELQPEERRRGLFAVTVYRSRLEVEATFSTADLIAFGVAPESIVWERAQLVVGVADARGLQEQPLLAWRGQELPFGPGTASAPFLGPGLHTRLPELGPQSLETPIAFTLDLRGTRSLEIVPVGGETRVALASAWPSPKFTAGHLPRERSVGATGFRGEWRVPALATGLPRAWRAGEEPPMLARGGAEAIGVELFRPADGYQQVERSVKHAVLFIVLTFAALFLLDVTGPVPLHPLQYLLVGAALCVFYLLLLALSEHFGFVTAYLVAATAVTLQVSLYGRAVMRRRAHAWALPVTLVALYGYLLVVLRAEDWALLLGALGTFAVLALLMALTRRLDWYAVGQRRPVAPWTREAPAEP
jgi:inner membrane protein